MLAVRAQRPFSLDLKLPDLDAHLPAGRRVCEVRLLAVDKNFRHGQVLPGLLLLLAQYAKGPGYDFAIISGTVRQQKLYAHLGFVPFGPLVGTAPTLFQSMSLTLETFEERCRAILDASAASSWS